MFADYRDYAGSQPGKHYKRTLFRSETMLLGLNCLDPGQAQTPHAHSGADKFYFVIEGEGRFLVGGETRAAGPGVVVWAPAGVEHGVENAGSARLVLLVGIAPAPAESPVG